MHRQPGDGRREEVEHHQPDPQKTKFTAKADITLQDSERGGPYSFPYTLSGTVKHGKSITATVKVDGAVEPCANVKEFTVTMKKN